MLSAPDAAASTKCIPGFATNIAVIGPVGPRISGMVKDMSDGDFDIKIFEPGALAGGYTQNMHNRTIKNAALFRRKMRYGGGIALGKEIYERSGINYFYCGMIKSSPRKSGAVEGRYAGG